jgi:inosose dehydratase
LESSRDSARLPAHGLDMRSIYVNSSLHEESAAATSIDHVLAIARRAVDLGTRIIVTNPSPIRCGGPENKTDPQIRSQAADQPPVRNRFSRAARGAGL